jgi:hypothetical protein
MPNLITRRRRRRQWRNALRAKAKALKRACKSKAGTDDGMYIYTYNASAQLGEVRDKVTGATVLNVARDAMGRIRRLTTPSETISYVWFDERVVQRGTALDQPIEQFAYGTGVNELIVVSRQGKNIYPILDRLGSMLAVTDDLGDVIERYAYGPFGETQIFAPDGVTTRPSSAVGVRQPPNAGAFEAALNVPNTHLPLSGDQSNPYSLFSGAFTIKSAQAAQLK